MHVSLNGNVVNPDLDVYKETGSGCNSAYRKHNSRASALGWKDCYWFGCYCRKCHAFLDADRELKLLYGYT